MFTAYYSIVYYAPNLFRKERMNVGAIVTVPEIGYAEWDRYAKKTRLKQLNPNYRETQLANYFESLDSELLELGEDLENAYTKDQKRDQRNGSTKKSVDRALEDFARTHAGTPFHISTFRWADFEREADSTFADHFLKNLIERYVKPESRSQPTTAVETHPTLKKQFSNFLRSNSLLGFKGKPGFNAEYRLRPDLEFTFDYGIKNGQYHLIELFDLSEFEAEDDKALREAGETYMKFAEAQNYSMSEEAEVQNYTLLRDVSQKKREILSSPLQMLEERSELWNFDDSDERAELMRWMKEVVDSERKLDGDF